MTASPADPGREPNRASQVDPPARVLIVDDNLDSAESMAELLRIWRYDVRISQRGEEAIEEARSFRPAVILLDIGLPGLDGYQVAARLRAEGLGGELLVALTGYGAEEDRQRSREAGFDHHLTKPVHPGELKRLLLGEA